MQYQHIKNLHYLCYDANIHTKPFHALLRAIHAFGIYHQIISRRMRHLKSDVIANRAHGQHKSRLNTTSKLKQEQYFYD